MGLHREGVQGFRVSMGGGYMVYRGSLGVTLHAGVYVGIGRAH